MKTKMMLSSPAAKQGQILVLFVILLPVLFLCLGLALDVGIMYLADARLSKAVDSVALRIGNTPGITTERRQKIALSAIRANMPGFLENYNTWGTTSGNVSSAGGETITIQLPTPANNRAAWSKLEINTIGTADSSTPGVPTVEVVTTTVTATYRQPSYFMILGGIEKVDIRQQATAKRFPAVVALVLDISASMLEDGNTGTYPTNASRANDLLESIDTFVDFFDESRDFFIVVSYSHGARVEWPPTPSSGINYYPSQYFLTGIGGDATKALHTYISSHMKWAGTTNPYEGFRVAARNVKALLDLYPTAVRDQIDVNYVLMTDGAFNTFTTYARGYGYGSNWHATSGSSSSTVATASARPAWLSSTVDFHLDPLLVGDFSGSVSAQLPSSKASTSFTTYNLTTLLNGVPKTGTIPIGVRSIVSSLSVVGNVTGTGSGAAQFNTNYLNSTNGIGSNVNQLYFPSSGNATTYASALPTPSPWKDWTHNVTKLPTKVGTAAATYNKFGSGVTYYGATTTPSSSVEMRIERAKIYNVSSKLPICPAIYLLNTQNPFRTSTSPRYADDPSQDIMTNSVMTMYPGLRIYANHYGYYLKDNYANTTSNPLSGNLVASNDNIPVLNYSIGSLCMTDLYPDYAAGGFLNDTQYNNTTSTTSSLDNDIFDAQGRAQWTHFWSLRSNAWNNSASGDNDAYWLIQAQAWLVRSQQKARVFAIDYEGGSPNDMRRIANNNNGAAFSQYSTHKIGEYYDVTTLGNDGLEEAFEDIANRIALKLTK